MTDFPDELGSYLLLERLHRGAMADVFLAKARGEHGVGKIVALKTLHREVSDDGDFLERFLDEARLSAQLNHANVARVIEVGNEAGQYFIASEYVPGQNLRAVLQHYRRFGVPMPIPMAAYIGYEICEGLDYAHAKKDTRGNPLGIVHRGLSPQNVLLSYEGEVKLIDFGMAKASSQTHRTQVGQRKGKIGYMSPEQVRGAELDARSDLFSLGVVLFEAVTCVRLFAHDSDAESMRAVDEAEIPDPRGLNPAIPDELEAILQKALARSPDDRFSSAAELQMALQRFVVFDRSPYSAKHLSQVMRGAFADQMMEEAARLERLTSLSESKEAQALNTPPGGRQPPPNEVDPHDDPDAHDAEYDAEPYSDDDRYAADAASPGDASAMDDEHDGDAPGDAGEETGAGAMTYVDADEDELFGDDRTQLVDGSTVDLEALRAELQGGATDAEIPRPDLGALSADSPSAHEDDVVDDEDVLDDVARSAEGSHPADEAPDDFDPYRPDPGEDDLDEDPSDDRAGVPPVGVAAPFGARPGAADGPSPFDDEERTAALPDAFDEEERTSVLPNAFDEDDDGGHTTVDPGLADQLAALRQGGAPPETLASPPRLERADPSASAPVVPAPARPRLPWEQLGPGDALPPRISARGSSPSRPALGSAQEPPPAPTTDGGSPPRRQLPKPAVLGAAAVGVVLLIALAVVGLSGSEEATSPIRVQVTPSGSAQVTVGGRLITEDETHRFPPGEYDLMAVAPGFERHTQRITVFEAEPEAVFTVLLQPLPEEPDEPEPEPEPVEGTPESFTVKFVSTEPGVTILIEGEEVGTTPNVETTLETGRAYRFEAVREGYESQQGVFAYGGERPPQKVIPVALEKAPEPKQVVKKQPQRRAVKLWNGKWTRGRTGKLTVTSEPSGADVYIDGVPTNRQTPVLATDPLLLPVGSHEIHIQLGGFQSEVKRVRVLTNRTSTLRGLTLEADPF